MEATQFPGTGYSLKRNAAFKSDALPKRTPLYAFNDQSVSEIEKAYQKQDLEPAKRLLRSLSDPHFVSTIQRQLDLNLRVVTFIGNLYEGSLKAEVCKCFGAFALFGPLEKNVEIRLKAGQRLYFHSTFLKMASDFFEALLRSTMGKDVRREPSGRIILNLSQSTTLETFQAFAAYLQTKDLPKDFYQTLDLFLFARYVHHKDLCGACFESLERQICNEDLSQLSTLEMALKEIEKLVDETKINSLSVYALVNFCDRNHYSYRPIDQGILLTINALGLLFENEYLQCMLEKFIKGIIIPHSFTKDQLDMAALIPESIRHACLRLEIKYMNLKSNYLPQLKQLFPKAECSLISTSASYMIDYSEGKWIFTDIKQNPVDFSRKIHSREAILISILIDTDYDGNRNLKETIQFKNAYFTQTVLFVDQTLGNIIQKVTVSLENPGDYEIYKGYDWTIEKTDKGPLAHGVLKNI